MKTKKCAGCGLNNNIREIEKSNYWRGFQACMILIVAPLVLGIIIFLNVLIIKLG